jgi:hypothetical protein
MRLTKKEKVVEEAKRKEQAEKIESRLAEMVAEFDLDYEKPFTLHEEAIFKDWAPRRYPELLMAYPTWEFLPEMERTLAVIIVKFGLSTKLSLKDGPAIQKALGKKLDSKGSSHSSNASEINPELFKFRKG